MNENFSFSVLPLLYAVLSVWNDDISFVSLQGIKRAKKKNEGYNERKSKMICEWKVCPWGWKWPIFESKKKKGVGVVISGVLIEGHLQK